MQVNWPRSLCIKLWMRILLQNKYF